MSNTMRAIVIHEPGGPEVLRLAELPVPEPGAGQVRVRVATSGVNRADLLQRRGSHPAPDGWPADIPGLEYSGVIDAVGKGVTTWAPGDAVTGIVGGGGYAEYLLTEAETATTSPGGMDPDVAGAIPEVFQTAFDAVVVQEGLKAGETLLIHAVGSGVGTAAAQLGRALGARVIGTSRTPAKLERAAALGIDEPVPAGPNWPDRVLELTDGRGVDVILDLVGGPYLAGNQRVIARCGRHIVVGVPGGLRADVDLRSLMTSRSSIRGTRLRARSTPEKAELARAFEEQVVPRFESGELQPVIDRILPAAQAGDAHRAMEANENFGKILLKW